MKALRKLKNCFEASFNFDKSFKISYFDNNCLGHCKIRTVNTLSPLAAAFNSKLNRKIKSKFFQNEGLGLFGVPELRDPEGFYLLKENAVLEADRLVSECCSTNRKRKMVEVFDHLSNVLCKVADLSEFIRMTHPSPKFSAAAENASVSIGVLVEQLNTNRELYDALKNSVIKGDIVPTTEIDDHVSQLYLFDFEQSGIHLDEMDRKKVAHLNEIILTTGQRFLSSTSEPREISKDSLPESLRHHFATDGNAVIIPGLFSDSHTETTREAGYKIFLHPEEIQEGRLAQLLEARHIMSSACGFQSFAHRSMNGSLAENPELVLNFLNLLTKELRPEAYADFASMTALKRSSLPLAPWDVSYYTSIARSNALPLEMRDKLPSYFSLGTVMEGLSDLFSDLYDVTLQVEEELPGEFWTPNVYKLTVIHKGTDVLGHIYCDFFDHPNKSPQDCHFTIRGGKVLEDGSYQNPIVVVHLNLHAPTWTAPSFLNLSMLENLFHEMGHAMHSMLARTRYQHVTGTRCSTDFAEIPSILMEYFANDVRVLHRISKHYKTGERIPIDTIQEILASKSIYSAAEMQLQTFYSHLDQRYHGSNRWPTTKSTTDILAETQNETYCLPHVPNTAWQLRFGHLVGYGAKYYSYLMSRAVASWIWQKYFSEDPFNRNAGEKFFQEVLRHGGGKPPKLMVAEYLGQNITPENLVNALMTDVLTRKTPTKY